MPLSIRRKADHPPRKTHQISYRSSLSAAATGRNMSSAGGSNPLFATVGDARNNLRTIHEEGRTRELPGTPRESRPILRSTTSTGSTSSGHHLLQHSSRGSREDSRELHYSLLDVATPSCGHVITEHNQSTFRLVKNGESNAITWNIFLYHTRDLISHCLRQDEPPALFIIIILK